MYRLFEKLLHPYPEAESPALPKTFAAFVWACTAGLRGYLVLLALLSAAIFGGWAVLFNGGLAFVMLTMVPRY